MVEESADSWSIMVALVVAAAMVVAAAATVVVVRMWVRRRRPTTMKARSSAMPMSPMWRPSLMVVFFSYKKECSVCLWRRSFFLSSHNIFIVSQSNRSTHMCVCVCVS